ncbi:MAG: quinone oxidoreductase [Chloroflexota bacterium]
MRAIVVTRFGGPDVLELQERATPVPGDGELLVDVEAAGVNYRDVYEREGTGGGQPPLIAGIEGAGMVSAIGPAVTAFAAGDRVAWAAAQGSYAEQLLVPAGKAVPIPPGVSAELAASAILQGMTAHYLATTTYPVAAGDTVIVHAAAGGVGQLLTQIVKLRGGRVIATTSGGEKARLAREAGADEVIGYDGFAGRARDLTGGRGVAAVFDGIGRTTFDEGLAALRPRGSMVLIGSASGPAPAIDPRRLVSGSLFLTRPTIRDYTATREELLERAGQVFGWIADGSLKVRIGARYQLEDARRAHEDLASRSSAGKLVLVLRP